MNNFRLILRKIAQTKYLLSMFAVGLVFTIGGLLVMNSAMNTSNMTSATATITNIESTYNAETEAYEYAVTVEYTDADGNQQQATLSGFDSSWSEGKVIEVKYDPSDPSIVYCPSVATIFYVVMGLGIVLIIISVVRAVMVIKQPLQEANEFNKVDMSNVSQDQINEVKNSTEEMKPYYFHYTGTLGQSYIMETNPDRKPIMEAVSQKAAIVTKFQFNFINHLTGIEELKECSHTTSTEYGESSFALETSANFKINGKNCWNVLGELGYSIEPVRNGVHVDFDILKYGVKVAHLEHAGTNVATGKNYKLGNIATNGIYTVECRESDVENIFLACFIIARTYDYA